MNIPEPELRLEERRSSFFEMKMTMKQIPSIAKISGRRYDIDDQEWRYFGFPSHGYFPTREEEQAIGWYPIENYLEIKE